MQFEISVLPPREKLNKVLLGVFLFSLMFDSRFVWAQSSLTTYMDGTQYDSNNVLLQSDANQGGLVDGFDVKPGATLIVPNQNNGCDSITNVSSNNLWIPDPRASLSGFSRGGPAADYNLMMADSNISTLLKIQKGVDCVASCNQNGLVNQAPAGTGLCSSGQAWDLSGNPISVASLDGNGNYKWKCYANALNIQSCSATQKLCVTYGSSLVAAPTSLCNYGASSSALTLNTTTHTWSWSCGMGSATQTCGANYLEASCGADDGGAGFTSPPTKLCAVGFVSSAPILTANIYSWSCSANGNPANTKQCQGTAAVSATSCGNAQDLDYYYRSPPVSNLCLDGSLPLVSADFATGKFTWSCAGSPSPCTTGMVKPGDPIVISESYTQAGGCNTIPCINVGGSRIKAMSTNGRFHIYWWGLTDPVSGFLPFIADPMSGTWGTTENAKDFFNNIVPFPVSCNFGGPGSTNVFAGGQSSLSMFNGQESSTYTYNCKMPDQGPIVPPSQLSASSVLNGYGRCTFAFGSFLSKSSDCGGGIWEPLKNCVNSTAMYSSTFNLCQYKTAFFTNYFIGGLTSETLLVQAPGQPVTFPPVAGFLTTVLPGPGSTCPKAEITLCP